MTTPPREPNRSPDSAPVPPSRRRRPRWHTGLIGAIAAAVLLLDIATKVLVVALIEPGQNIRILGGLVYLTNIRNPGAAFSMGTSLTWLLTLIAMAVAAFIIWTAFRVRSTSWAVCLGLILGGALGNVVDRLFRAPGVLRGHVVDFVSVFAPNAQVFPAFNAADSAISVGGVILVVVALAGFELDGTRHRRRKDRPVDHGADRPGDADAVSNHDGDAAGSGGAQ